MNPTSELTDMLTGGASASDVTDKIKEILYAKAAEKIDAVRPAVANALFNGALGVEEDEESDGEDETDDVETSEEEEE